jgi:hypothetical protein
MAIKLKFQEKSRESITVAAKGEAARGVMEWGETKTQIQFKYD